MHARLKTKKFWKKVKSLIKKVNLTNLLKTFGNWKSYIIMRKCHQTNYYTAKYIFTRNVMKKALRSFSKSVFMKRYYALQSLDVHARYKHLLLARSFRAIKSFKGINEELNRIKYQVIVI